MDTGNWTVIRFPRSTRSSHSKAPPSTGHGSGHVSVVRRESNHRERDSSGRPNGPRFDPRSPRYRPNDIHTLQYTSDKLYTMQNEEYASHHPSSYRRRRIGRNKRRAVTAAVMFAGLVIGALAGRWSVTDLKQFLEEGPPTPSKDPHATALDDFEGM